ncbi:MAG TPA: hypothetical protein PLJ33_01715 [Peptococcaceae bacterium]|nr:hypothetical protein [Peptococcaceae bacterium]HPZ71731.1 hypothetical protein [Peptococcaceae bacterium]HQD53556.1 hypothetical protein [Peptococcaceae bacterium]
METVFAVFIALLLGSSTLYLLIAFVLAPLIKIIKENARLKQ